MLKIRDLGINIIPAMMPPAGNTRGYFMGYVEYPDMDGSNTCPDMSCTDTYRRKPTKKAPSKKKPAKKPSKKPAKKPSKKAYRAGGFGSAAIAQLGRQLEEQLRDVH
jgi:hypothetical protein